MSIPSERASGARTATKVHASVSPETVRLAFNKLPNVADNYAIWVQQIFLDPEELIVRDDDAAMLYRVPFTIEGDGVAFGEWQPVTMAFVNASLASARSTHRRVAAGSRHRGGTGADSTYNSSWLSANERARQQKARAGTAAAPAAEADRGDSYPAQWLSAKERQRIAAFGAGAGWSFADDGATA